VARAEALGDDEVEGLAQRLTSGESEQALGAVVPKLDQPGRVGDDQGIWQVAQERVG
jgi:hypothetical protein